MLQVFLRLKRVLDNIKKENLHKLFFLTLLIALLGVLGISYLEKDINLADALWWSFVTITTVGYGDITPVSLGGRLIAILIMLFGIGFLGMFTATIASIFVENKIKEGKGLKKVEIKDHFILCGWSYKVRDIIEELRADSKAKDTPIVIVANIPEKPVEDKYTFFIQGEIDHETMDKANLKQARGVIILADETVDPYSRDAKTVLAILTVKTLNPHVYTCVEIVEAKNIHYCQMAKADEIIIIGELSTNLLVQAALDHGITRIVTELVSNRYGNEFYKISPPAEFIGAKFLDLLINLKEKQGILPVAVESIEEDRFAINPPGDYIIKEKDQLIIIAETRPSIK
jgi:voltage-gated potassium channel